MMKRNRTGIVAAAAVVGVLGGAVAYAKLDDPVRQKAEVVALAESAPSTEVVVVVNGREVTRAEVDREFEAMVGAQLAAVPADQRAGIRSQLQSRIVDGVIVRTLLEQAVEAQGIEVDDSRLKASLEEIKSSLPAGATFEEYAKGLGTSPDEIEQDLRLGLRIDELMSRQVGRVEPPSGDDVESFYAANEEMFQIPETAEVRHILFAVPAEAGAESRAAKRKLAEQTREQLLSGDSALFATLAADRSECPSAKQGGLLGRLARGDTVPAFEEAVFTQAVGEVGEVVESPFGYHVIRVDEVSPAGKASLAEVTPFVEQRLRQDRERAAVAGFVQSLRGEASIVYPGEKAA